jgi:hypothetical protein
VTHPRPESLDDSSGPLSVHRLAAEQGAGAISRKG